MTSRCAPRRRMPQTSPLQIASPVRQPSPQASKGFQIYAQHSHATARERQRAMPPAADAHARCRKLWYGNATAVNAGTSMQCRARGIAAGTLVVTAVRCSERPARPRSRYVASHDLTASRRRPNEAAMVSQSSSMICTHHPAHQKANEGGVVVRAGGNGVERHADNVTLTTRRTASTRAMSTRRYHA